MLNTLYKQEKRDDLQRSRNLDYRQPMRSLSGGAGEEEPSESFDSDFDDSYFDDSDLDDFELNEPESNEPELNEPDKIEDVYSSIEPPVINIGNFDYLIAGYDSTEVLNNIIEVLIDIYAENKTTLIVEVLLYMLNSDDSKYDIIINLFRNNDKFMESLNSDTPLYKKLTQLNIEKNINNIEEEDEEESKELSEEEKEDKYSISGFTENKCVKEHERLNQIIKTGGPFTKKNALYLEYCKGRKKKKTLKKDTDKVDIK